MSERDDRPAAGAAAFTVEIFPDVAPGDVHHALLNQAVEDLADDRDGTSIWTVVRELGAGHVLVDAAFDPASGIELRETTAIIQQGEEYLPLFTSARAADAFRAANPELWPSERAKPIWAPVALAIAEDDDFSGVLVVADTGISWPVSFQMTSLGIPRFGTNEEAKHLLTRVHTDPSYLHAWLEALFARPVFTLIREDDTSATSGEAQHYEIPVITLADGRSAVVIGTSPAELFTLGLTGVEIASDTLDEILKQLVVREGVEAVAINPDSKGITVPVSWFA